MMFKWESFNLVKASCSSWRYNNCGSIRNMKIVLREPEDNSELSNMLAERVCLRTFCKLLLFSTNSLFSWNEIISPLADHLHLLAGNITEWHWMCTVQDRKALQQMNKRWDVCIQRTVKDKVCLSDTVCALLSGNAASLGNIFLKWSSLMWR